MGIRCCILDDWDGHDFVSSIDTCDRTHTPLRPGHELEDLSRGATILYIVYAIFIIISMYVPSVAQWFSLSAYIISGHSSQKCYDLLIFLFQKRTLCCLSSWFIPEPHTVWEHTSVLPQAYRTLADHLSAGKF